MITTCYSNYQLNAERFNNLFSDEVDINTLDSLGKSAADGNLDCIDMLQNLALRYDDVGKKAENILFDLFSGKTKGKIGIEGEIQKASLKLYETANSDKFKDYPSMNKLRSRSKLLYIAGSAVENEAEKKDISTTLQRNYAPSISHERFERDHVWSNNRMLLSDEIEAGLLSLVPNNGDHSVYFPLNLISPIGDEHNFNYHLSGVILANKDGLKNTEIFPISVGEHWILFTLYQDKTNNNKECVVFDSYRGLNRDAKNAIIEAANLAGVNPENITFISQNLQENVPNGCGVFAVKAAEAIINSSESKPVDAINNFINEFSKLSAEDQRLYNIQNRQQLYGEHIALINRRAGV